MDAERFDIHEGSRTVDIQQARHTVFIDGTHGNSNQSVETAGNSKTTSFPVSRRYTEENESSLYSSDVASFESRYLET